LRRANGGTLMQRIAQCHCGSLRATTSGEPLLVNMCHCKACQRRTGALAGNGAAFAKEQGEHQGLWGGRSFIGPDYHLSSVAASRPPQMGWTAPDGIDVPQ